MFIFCKPEQSEEEHQLILAIEEELMQKLGLPYRVIQLCTGDLSNPSAKSFDIEAWLPSQNRYAETHSCSNCTDFQSRRLIFVIDPKMVCNSCILLMEQRLPSAESSLQL